MALVSVACHSPHFHPELDAKNPARIMNRLIRPGFHWRAAMKDFRILLKNVRPYAGLFAVAFILMAIVGLFEAGRTALLKSIIDILSESEHAVTTGLASRIDVTRYLPVGINPLPLIAGLLVSFTLIRGASEYLSNVLMWRIGVGAVVNLRQRL